MQIQIATHQADDRDGLRLAQAVAAVLRLPVDLHVPQKCNSNLHFIAPGMLLKLHRRTLGVHETPIQAGSLTPDPKFCLHPTVCPSAPDTFHHNAPMQTLGVQRQLLHYEYVGKQGT